MNQAGNTPNGVQPNTDGVSGDRPGSGPPYAGLNFDEVEASRAHNGANRMNLNLPETFSEKLREFFRNFVEKFQDPVIRILMIAAVLAIAVGFREQGHFVEGIGILIAVLLATLLATLTEGKAQAEFAKIVKTGNLKLVKVYRGGKYQTVVRQEIVAGDIVHLEQGDEVPADGVIWNATELQVDEAKLTGYPLPQTKVAVTTPAAEKPVTETALDVDRLYQGATLTSGLAYLKVDAVGSKTILGRESLEITMDSGVVTPLNRQLSRLSRWIGVIGLLVAASLFLALLGRDYFGMSREAEALRLDPGQWWFVLFLGAGAAIALSRVWLPIAMDAFVLAHEQGLMRKCPRLPVWLGGASQEDADAEASGGFARYAGILGWLATIVAGALTVISGYVIAHRYGGGLPTDSAVLPAIAVERLLMFFMIAVTVIVVAVPEGLAMSVVLSLGYSMQRMMRDRILVKTLHSAETSGAVTVICSDKTGTLTEGKMRVGYLDVPTLGDRTLTPEELSGAAGQGPSEPGTTEPWVRFLVESICANSTAELEKDDAGVVQVRGNRDEGALLHWVQDRNWDYLEYRYNFQRITQWPFDSTRKSMATLGKSAVLEGNPVLLLVKGASERLLDQCTRIRLGDGVQDLTPQDREGIRGRIQNGQARGMRTLGFAYREQPGIASGMTMNWNLDELARDLIWVGFIAIADPLRPEVFKAIQTCREAGIAVKIVTGDSPVLAREIAVGLHLFPQDAIPENAILEGKRFAQMSDEEASQAIAAMQILAKAMPSDKTRLVKLLQEQNHVVAVTGDGANDAAALHQANVGMAMGSGAELAKEAADIVLLDDSFQSVAVATMWGRSLYENIQRFLLFQLTINVAALAIAFLGPFLGIGLPLTVIQMLWVNLIMDTFAALALATEPPTWAVMKRPPRHPNDFIISKTMGRNILLTAGCFLAVFITMMMVFQRDGHVSPKELTIFFTVFVLLQFWNLFNARCLGRTQSAFSGIVYNPGFLAIAFAILAGQILITQFGGEVFRVTPLSLPLWFGLLAATSLVLVVGELFRAVQRARGRK